MAVIDTSAAGMMNQTVLTVSAWLLKLWPLANHLMRKANQLSVRLDPELMKDFEECCRITGMDPMNLTRECLKAFIELVKRDGEIRMPLAIVPKSVAAGKAAARPRSDVETDAPVALPGNPSTASMRLSLNEDPAAPVVAKSPGPRARSTRPAITEIVEREKGKQ